MNDTDITLNSPSATVNNDSSEAVDTERDEDELLKACSDEEFFSDAVSNESMLLLDSFDHNMVPNLVSGGKTEDDNQPSCSTIQGNKMQTMDDTESENFIFDDMSEDKNQASGSTKKRKKTQKMNDSKSPRLVFGEMAGEKDQPTASPIKRQKPRKMDSTRSYSERNVTVLLVGKTGSGKSTTGNVILRSTVFEVFPAAHLVTRECQEEKGNINNIPVNIVDTPGFFSLELENSIVQAKIGGFLKNRPNMWPLVVVLCTQSVRFTKEDKSVINFIKENFGSRVYDNMVVVSTDGMLNTEDKMPEWFKLFLKKIDNRTFHFNADSPDIDHQLTLFITKCQMMLNKPENLNYNLVDYNTAQLRIKEKKEFRRSQKFRPIQNRTNVSPFLIGDRKRKSTK